MYNFFISLNPINQALIGGIFTFLITTLGASIVFFFKSINRNIMDSMISISAGIMLSASFFSLLEPAISISDEMGQISWLIALVGLLFGGIVLSFCNRAFDHVYSNSTDKFSFKRCLLLMTSITLHNIPEGLVIGVGFGAITSSSANIGIISAITLTVGIAIQNFPEGAAISLPMRREGISRLLSFMFGALSGIVEPIFAVIGAILVLKVKVLLPFVLSFAAGAMIFVVILELIPESQANNKKDLMALLAMIGFGIMMILEILLG